MQQHLLELHLSGFLQPHRIMCLGIFTNIQIVVHKIMHHATKFWTMLQNSAALQNQ